MTATWPPDMVLHRSDAGDALRDALRQPKDFCIRVEDESTEVHQSVMGSVGEYFAGMYRSAWKECETGVLNAQFLSAKVVQKLVSYVYGKKISMRWPDMGDIVHLVDMWGMLKEKHLVETYFIATLIPENFLQCYFYADRYYIPALKREIGDRFSEILSSDRYKSLGVEEILYIISDVDVRPSSNAAVRVCVAWALADLNERALYFGELLECLSLDKCNPIYLKWLYMKYRGSLLKEVILKEMYPLLQSSFLVIEGSGILSVDVHRQTTVQLGKLAAMSHCPATCLTEKGLFLAGGYKMKGLEAVDMDTCRIWDPVTMTTTLLPPLPKDCVGRLTMPVAFRGRVYAINQARTRRDVRVWGLDLSKPCQWRNIDRVPDNTISFICSHKELLYAWAIDGGNLRLRRYNPATNIWTYAAKPPDDDRPSGRGACVAVAQDLYFVGEPGRICVKYSTVDDSWTKLARPAVAREGGCAVSIHGKIVLLGGVIAPRYGRFPQTEIYDITRDVWYSITLSFTEKFPIGVV